MEDALCHIGDDAVKMCIRDSTCWVPSFDISPRDKWERLAYTRTFAKEVFNDADVYKRQVSMLFPNRSSRRSRP